MDPGTWIAISDSVLVDSEGLGTKPRNQPGKSGVERGDHNLVYGVWPQDRDAGG